VDAARRCFIYGRCFLRPGHHHRAGHGRVRPKDSSPKRLPPPSFGRGGLPFKKYDGSKGSDVRQQIVRGLEPRVSFDRFRKLAEESADALDAVISSFAALAAYRGNVVRPEGDGTTVSREGWIAVHA
jgi:hypothetical protein